MFFYLCRMKQSILFLICACMLSACGTGKADKDTTGNSICADTLRMRQVVETLCSPDYEGRKAGSPNDSAIASYIGERLLSEGFSPYFSDGMLMDIHKMKINTFNVVMEYQVPDAIGSVLIGAHYDHLGRGGKGSGSLRPDTSAIHFGADDNASGVAAALETAILLKKSNIRYNIIFSAFAAEEIGLLGSKVLADSLQKLGETPSLMLNLDMVGRLHSDSTHNYVNIQGAGTFIQADSLLAVLDSIPPSKNFVVKRSARSGYGPSDFASFYRTGVPILAFTTGAHSDYHTPMDTPDKIRYEGMANMVDYIVTLVQTLSQDGIVPTYLEAAEPDAPKMANFKVSLGCIPDFTYEGEGFCAGTIIKGRPSEKAGMKDGDIVVRMDSTTIHNIEEYMAYLGTLQKGQLINIVVKRGNEHILLEVQL